MPFTPINYPKGVSSQPPRSAIKTLPAVPNPVQIVKQEDFLPYRSGDYTLTQTNGAAAQFAFNGGAVQVSTTGSTAADKAALALPSLSFQMVQGNAMWFDTKIAIRPASATDTNIFTGLFGSVDPTAATDGIYFLKPSGGTTVNVVIKKGGTTTTFQNIGDVSKPSGIYNDGNSVAGTLSGTISGGALTAIAVATAGSGYQQAPILVVGPGAGSNGYAYCQIGSTAYGAQSYYQSSLTSTQIQYGSLYAPYVMNGGSGYTNGAASIDVCHLLDFQMFFDGKGTAAFAINGRPVLRLGATVSEQPPILVAAGATTNVATSASNYFGFSTTVSTSLYPVQPPTSSIMFVLPTLPLEWATALQNTTANPRVMFIDEYTVGTELN